MADKVDTLTITNQTAFDTLRTSIINICDTSSHETIRVEFGPGIYYYDEDNNLCWNNKDWRNHNLELIGCPDAIFIARTTTSLTDVSWKNGSICFENEETMSGPYHYERWSHFTEASDTCTFVSNYNGSDTDFEFSIANSKLPFIIPNSASIQFTEWFRTHVYSIPQQSNKFQTSFVLEDVKKCYEKHTVDTILRPVYYPNYDYYSSRGQKYPRYRFISNPEKTSTGKTLYYCTAGSFANFWKTKLKSFTVKDMHFLCNKKEDYRELFRLCDDTVSQKISIEDCEFSFIRGQVLYFERTNNVVVKNNKFTDCYDNCVVSDNGSDSTQVHDNTFERCGKGMDQNFCIKCGGKGFSVQRNTIKSFSYAAIGVGKDLEQRPKYKISGTVENNIIDNSEYISEDSILQHNLIDAGAIYTWCWNDSTVIRDNIIRNYGGIHQYRGIFCDQGTKNVTITGNTISNIQNLIWKNEQSYIDVAWVESSHDTIPDHNTGNYCYGNYFDSESARVNFPINYDCHCDVINVHSQQDFDSLSVLVDSIINNDGRSNILIRLDADSTYMFDNNHLLLENINAPVSIKIEGNSTRLIPRTCAFSPSDFQAESGGTTIIRPWLRTRNNVSGIDYTDGWTEWRYANTPVYRISSSPQIIPPEFNINTGLSTLTKTTAECVGMYLHLTEWYTSQILPIIKITNGIIFFTTDGESPLTLEGLNRDFTQSRNRLMPRYRIYETDFAKQYSNAGTLLTIKDSRMCQVHISGIHVDSNFGCNPLIDSDSLLCTSFNISSCSFENIKSDVINARNTQNLTVEGCVFCNSYANGVVSDNKCLRSTIRRNSFQNTGTGMKQSFAVICRGTDFLIENNEITNFSFGGIGIGMWYGHHKDTLITGIVRNNRISMDDTAIENYEWRTLIGGNAIYSWTQTDGIWITDNQISNLRGISGIGAIFGENGAKNLTITNNEISDIYPDKFGQRVYSINVPWSNEVASFVSDHNTNNHHEGNRYNDELITTDHQYGVICFDRFDPVFGTDNMGGQSQSPRPQMPPMTANSSTEPLHIDLNGFPISSSSFSVEGNKYSNNKSIVR